MVVCVWRRLPIQQPHLGKLPDDDAGRHTDVQRVFGAKLWNLQAAVAHIHHALLHPLHLIAEDDGGGLVGWWVGRLVC